MSVPMRVSSYGDLIGDSALNVTRADAVAVALLEDHDIVFYIPNWLLAEKSFGRGEHHPEVLSGEIKAETDKAYQVEIGDGVDWVPKSVIRVYEMDADADIHVPRTTLNEFGVDE